MSAVCLGGPNYMGPESPCSKRAEAHFAFSKIPTETLGHFRFTLSLSAFLSLSLTFSVEVAFASLSKSRKFESGMIMDVDFDCVERRSSSTQQEEVAGIAEEKHFKEQQETEVHENFSNLKNLGNSRKFLGMEMEVKKIIQLVFKFKIAQKACPPLDEAEETRLVKSADSESFLVGSVNEAEQNHLVKSDDLESWNETVVKYFKTNSRHKSVEAGEKMVQNGDGGKVKPLRGKLKIEVIDDTAVIDSTAIPRSGNGCSRQKSKQETDERRDKRTRRKAKGGKQGLEANGKGKIVAQIVEVQKNESGAKRVYSRKEMEVLRYINSEEQRKMWMEIRCSLGPVVLKEYDGLENCTNHKHIRVKFDPRQQSAKKEEAPAILNYYLLYKNWNELSKRITSIVQNIKYNPAITLLYDYAILFATSQCSIEAKYAVHRGFFNVLEDHLKFLSTLSMTLDNYWKNKAALKKLAARDPQYDCESGFSLAILKELGYGGYKGKREPSENLCALKMPRAIWEVSSSNVDDEMQNLHPLDPAYGHSVGGKDSYADPEECSEDSDSDEDYSSIQRRAFLVEGEPDFDSGPPEDGLEYLRRVRYYFAFFISCLC
ncbi:hypothetical protein CK203_086958 [Vitis vinifera]|uniref:Uncharacterized protein n=1 Tax=Vitis vinifera TaxID=29760 RepID=A0A438FIZ4_VITVI|nr:hypothetical protein CK203_086958 [Vitis vinifera]